MATKTEGITVGMRELDRLKTVQAVVDGNLKPGLAARRLGITARQLRRVVRRYRAEGPAGMASRLRGQPSNHQLPPGLAERALGLIRDRYADFGPTLACEKLAECHGLVLAKETVRRLMSEAGYWVPRRQRPPKIYQPRRRRDCLGELVQIDGSDHPWFEDRAPACTALVYVDDATSRIMAIHFAHSESAFSYFIATRAYLERHGKPAALYSDKASVFRVNHPAARDGGGCTQFGRALYELNIEGICANSSQAKGRVERAHLTLQDRLVKELRLRGISTIQAGNAYLPEFCEDFNQRFAVLPRSNHDAHRPLLKTENLDLILSHQKTACLSKNLTAQFQKVIYQIQSDRPDYALRHAQVTICENAKGEVTILYKNKPLPYTTFKKLPHQAEVVETKLLNQAIQTPKPPAPDHPWRQYGQHLNGTPHGAD